MGAALWETWALGYLDEPLRCVRLSHRHPILAVLALDGSNNLTKGTVPGRGNPALAGCPQTARATGTPDSITLRRHRPGGARVSDGSQAEEEAMGNDWMKLFAVACATVVLTGCATSGPADTIVFRLPRTAVTSSDGVEHQVPEGRAYEDGAVSLIATGTEGIVGVNLGNRSAATLRILWDQSAYVDEDGYSGRVVSGESRVITASLSQPTQSVPAGTRAAFYAVPASNTGGPFFATCQEAERRSVALLLALEV